MNNIKISTHTGNYLGSEEITKSIQEIASFRVINGKEGLKKFIDSLPTQDELLKNLKQKGLDSEKIYKLSKDNKSIVKELMDFGLEIASLKKAGVRPSSLMDLEYIVSGPSCNEHGEIYFTQDQIPHYVDVPYLVNTLGFTVDELLKDGLNKTYIHNELRKKFL